jgi:hypothetical protein
MRPSPVFTRSARKLRFGPPESRPLLEFMSAAQARWVTRRTLGMKKLRVMLPVAAAAIALSACGGGSGSTPSNAAPTTVVQAAPVGGVKTLTDAATKTAAAATTATTTGDADLDKADAELTSFENETAGLDQAANASQETK